jgi:hypothetical protein
MQYRRHKGQQVGPGPLNLRDRVSVARGRGDSFYFQEIERFRQLYDKLDENRLSFPKADYAQKEIKRKLIHLEHRARLAQWKTARLPKVLREAINGNYWRYSGGWISIAKDIMIR